MEGGRRRTNIEIRDELGQRLPCEVHGAQALPEECEPRPCAVLDEPPRLEKDKMKRVRIQRDIKPGLSVHGGKHGALQGKCARAPLPLQ
jgi:hypothetical protein